MILRTRDLVLALALAGLLPGTGRAQSAGPPPSPGPPEEGGSASGSAEATSPDAPSPRPRRKARAAEEREEAAEEEAGEGDVRIRADRQGGTDEHYWARGFVDLQVGPLRIQADELDLHQPVQPDGSRTRRIEASGNVVFMRGEERLAGERLTMDLDTGQGTFENARGFVEPGVFVEGRKIQRLAPDKYRVEGGEFTSCSQPNPRWSFTASSATIDVDDRITARNVFFRVKQVPAFYLPVLVYPIQEDQRSTGVLFPHFGYSSLRGFNVGTGFFWAMGRSFDQTFYFDRYSKFGYGLGHEFRYLLGGGSRANFRSYAFRPQSGGEWDYDLDWSAIQALPGRFRATVNVRRYSDLAFQQQFQESFDYATTRTQRASLNVQGTLLGTNVQAIADSTDTFFPDITRVNRRLPSLRLSRSSQRIGRTGIVYSVEGRAENLERGNTNVAEAYTRLDLAPEISRPWSTSFLQVSPRVQVRYTRYGATLDGRAATGPALDRRYLESDLELRGPTFSRVFNNPGGFYSDRFKHVIGPEVVWRYRTAVDEFDLIPKFDGIDQLLGTNEVQYALVQRLLAKRAGPAGKSIPHEFLFWRVGQTYYVKAEASEFDPNYSTAFFGPGGRPSHYSPVQSRLRIRPSNRLSANFDLEYDVNFKQLRNLTLAGTVESGRAGLQASWSRATNLAEDPAQRTPLRNTLRGAARLALLPNKLEVEGSADFDAIDARLVQVSGRLRYDVQCCGFMAEMIQYDLNGRDERQFRFSINLANIGSIGNFMGQDATEGRRRGLGGSSIYE